MKNIKIIVYTVLISAISIIGTVYATIKYNASEIGIISNNENWKPENLNEAINDLYENSNNNMEIIYSNIYLGDGVNLSYTVDNDYKKIIIQGDARAADTNIYFNVTSSGFTMIHDTGLGVVMDKTWDRTQVYMKENVKKDEVITMRGRYKGSYVIYGIK